MGLGQYNSLGEYCGPHTASSVFLILILHEQVFDIDLILVRLSKITAGMSLHDHKDVSGSPTLFCYSLQWKVMAYISLFLFNCMFYQLLRVQHSCSSTQSWSSVLTSIVETRHQNSRGCPLLFLNRNLGSFCA